MGMQLGQHGHAVWHGHVTLTWMLAWTLTYSMDVQHGHGHAAWT
jgi:hypothetical protein